MILFVAVMSLTLLLPTMILVYVLNWIPLLRRKPIVNYGFVGVLVGIATVWLAVEGRDGNGPYRALAGVIVLGVLVADYRSVGNNPA
jgi:hypothetical protein